MAPCSRWPTSSNPQAARDHRDRAARQDSSSQLSADGAGGHASDDIWSNCFSTCWRPSAAPATTRSPPIAATLADFTAHLRAGGRGIASRHRRPARIYLASSRRARLQAGVGGAAALRDPAALSFPLCRRQAPRRSGRGPRRAEARARAAEGAVDRRCRPAADAGAQRCRGREAQRRRSPARGAAAVSARNCSTPPACASPNWWLCRPRPPSAINA